MSEYLRFPIESIGIFYHYLYMFPFPSWTLKVVPAATQQTGVRFPAGNPIFSGSKLLKKVWDSILCLKTVNLFQMKKKEKKILVKIGEN